MSILVILLVLILCALLVQYLVPGGVQSLPGLLIFIVVLVLVVAGGWHFSWR